MGNQGVSFDTELFTRTATLFTLKRDILEPCALEALANEVLRRLASGAKRQIQTKDQIISEESVAEFCKVLVLPGPEAALRFIEDRRAEGVTRHEVYIGYICSAARQLGEDWEDGRLASYEVTIGTGHLYSLMRALRTERTTASRAFDSQRCALFAAVPGEDHGIGITVAADLFRENGWEIDLQIGTDHEKLIAHVERTEPDIIGLSLSTEGRLDSLVRLVVAIRLILPHAIIGVAPGTDIKANRIRRLVDIDLIFTGADSACADLERMIRSRH